MDHSMTDHLPGGHSAQQAKVYRFNRACALAALIFLVLTLGGRLAWSEYRGAAHYGDFYQYYMGGLMVRLGQAQAMYPVPKPGALTNPGFPQSSTPTPAYQQAAAAHGVSDDEYRYFQPPPFALFMVPLACLPLKWAYFIWYGLLILAVWGIGLQAGRIYERCRPGPSKVAGGLVLLVCCSTKPQEWVPLGNLSPLIGWLIGYAALRLSEPETMSTAWRSAAALTIGALAKYATVIFLPLLLVMRKWRTLLCGALLSAGILAGSLPILGQEPYRFFFHDILPTLPRTGMVAWNQSLYALLLRIQHLSIENGMPPSLATIFRFVQWGMLLGLLGLIFTRRRRAWEQPELLFATVTALVCWLLIFSPIFWPHYLAYLTPFWGWLAYRARVSAWGAAGAMLVLALTFLPSIPLARLLHLPRLPEPFFSHLLASVVVMGAMAVLFLTQRHKPKT